MQEGLGAASEIAKRLAHFYSYQISSQEFMTVIFILYIPELFERDKGMQLTVLSQIYQAITRAQTQLAILADKLSILRLQAVVPNLMEFLLEEKVSFAVKIYFISRDLLTWRSGLSPGHRSSFKYFKKL